jgi:L-threonylcarbamoyladenylate synthase
MTIEVVIENEVFVSIRQTETIIVDAERPDPDAIRKAGEIIRAGGLVAFPTETVYGLGANALDEVAVRSIFEAKGRPSNNPVIVHVSSVEQAKTLVAKWPASAQKLADRFWPGPLTFVLPTTYDVPRVVTAGGTTVAIRMPSHPVARAVIEAAGVPVAAPSANASSRISPTSAQHVLRTLDGKIDLVLDGGSTFGGIESTVIDLSQPVPRVLRPGLITLAQLVEVVEDVTDRAIHVAGPLRSPGMMERHYAPTAPVTLSPPEYAPAMVAALRQKNLRVGWLRMGQVDDVSDQFLIPMPLDAAGYAAKLYESLHLVEQMGVERIIIDMPPDLPDWRAVRDRLTRASAG